MPAQPLTTEQREDAARLKKLFRLWQTSRTEKKLEHSQEWAADRLGFGQSATSQYLNGKIPLNPEAASKFAALIHCQVDDFSPSIAQDIARLRAVTDTNESATKTIAAPYEAPAEDGSEPDLVIAQYDVGGAMGNGGKLILEAEPPGVIKSWRVDQEWLRLNVPVYTNVSNLCIVTGFGPSMKPIFNPGDPLLMDRGVNHIDHEGIYFFRLGDEGFIKIIQRVPNFDKPGFVLRIISKNKDDFPHYDISPKHPDFHVIGKILTVWRSEQY